MDNLINTRSWKLKCRWVLVLVYFKNEKAGMYSVWYLLISLQLSIPWSLNLTNTTVVLSVPNHHQGSAAIFACPMPSMPSTSQLWRVHNYLLTLDSNTFSWQLTTFPCARCSTSGVKRPPLLGTAKWHFETLDSVSSCHTRYLIKLLPASTTSKSSP